MFGIRRLGQLNHNAHALPVGLVAQIADAFQPAFTHGLGNALDQARLVHLVRQLRHNQAAAPAAHLLHMRFRPHQQLAAPGAVRSRKALFLVVGDDDATGRKIRALDEAHQVFHLHTGQLVPAFQHEAKRVNNLIQVMRRHRGGHAHRNAGAAID